MRPALAQTVVVFLLFAWLSAYALPAAAQTPPPDPRFGVVQAFEDATAANEAGAGYSRIVLRWDLIQPASSVDWKPANVPDPFVDAELLAGREVVAVLMGTPPWASADGSDSPKAVPDMAYWERFVRQITGQYRGRIKHWIIWNEPDVWDHNHPGSTWNGTEADYFELLKTAYLTVKQVDPEMQVHLTGLTYFWDQQHGREQYLARLLDQILADPEAAQNNYYFDAVVYHLYFKPMQAPKIIGEVQSILGERGITGKPIWINETNAPPTNDPGHPPSITPRYIVSLDEQRAFVLQEFSLAFAAGAERVEVYKMRDERGETAEMYGMLRFEGSRRPVFDAFKVMTTYLRDFQSARWETYGRVQAVTFDRGEETTTVLWTVGPSPASFNIRALGDSALLVDDAGNKRPLTARNGVYTIDLPGATCSDPGECFIGGQVLLLVERGSPAQRAGLPPAVVPTATLLPSTPTPLPAVPTATPTPTGAPPSATPAAKATSAPTPNNTERAPAGAATATVGAATAQPTATLQWAVATVPPEVPQASPTPVPLITMASVLTEERCLILALVGLAVFTASYGIQTAILRRRR